MTYLYPLGMVSHRRCPISLQPATRSHPHLDYFSFRAFEHSELARSQIDFRHHLIPPNPLRRSHRLNLSLVRSPAPHYLHLLPLNRFHLQRPTHLNEFVSKKVFHSTSYILKCNYREVADFGCCSGSPSSGIIIQKGFHHLAVDPNFQSLLCLSIFSTHRLSLSSQQQCR